MSTPKAGMVFLHELSLPGLPSGGRHLCVCLSREEYAVQTGCAVLASLRKVRSNWWRPLVEFSDFTPATRHAPLDEPRAVDVSQMVSVPIAKLSRTAGVVSDRVVADAMRVVPTLFQFRGPWEIRGAIHRVDGWPEGTDALLLLNDTALDSDRQEYYIVVPYRDGAWSKELVLVSPYALGEETGVLHDTDQLRLNEDLRSIFPLTA